MLGSMKFLAVTATSLSRPGDRLRRRQGGERRVEHGHHAARRSGRTSVLNRDMRVRWPATA
jgi:hypothetical protein